MTDHELRQRLERTEKLLALVLSRMGPVELSKELLEDMAPLSIVMHYDETRHLWTISA